MESLQHAAVAAPILPKDYEAPLKPGSRCSGHDSYIVIIEP